MLADVVEPLDPFGRTSPDDCRVIVEWVNDTREIATPFKSAACCCAIDFKQAVQLSVDEDVVPRKPIVETA